MAHIFISYSRVDRAFTERFEARLRRMFPDVSIWFDDHLHGGDIWWETILNQIAQCDVFIYLLSNESVRSPYCQSEFSEARRLQKRVITVQIRDHTELTDGLDDIQYVDMKAGGDDPDAWARLGGAIRLQFSQAGRRRPLWQPRTPKPMLVREPPRPEHAPEVDTPALQRPVPPGMMEQPVQVMRGRRLSGRLTIVTVAVTAGIFAIIVAFMLLRGDENGEKEDLEATGTDTAAALAGILTPATFTPEPTVTVTSTDAPTPTPTFTEMPSPTPTPTATHTPTLSATELEQTIEAEMQAALTENAQTASALETQTAIAETATAATSSAIEAQAMAALTLTATQWTPTPTPDLRATAFARLTQTQTALEREATAHAEATATQWIEDQTATADAGAQQPQAPSDAPSGHIGNVWFDTNATSETVEGRGIRVFVELRDVCNLRGVEIRPQAYFYFANGDPIPDTNGSYTSQSGYVSVGFTLTPETDRQCRDWSRVGLFIPYRELELAPYGSSGDSIRLRFHVRLYVRENNEELDRSDWVDFTYTF